MKPFQHAFIELAIRLGVLKFGEFTLKSGRKSPYFFNSGNFKSGKSLHAVGTAFAEAIQDYQITTSGLFGPAYKGIPLATATATAMYSQFGIDLPVTSSRKEMKMHGEGGMLIGAPLNGNILIIDDVITAGTAKREAIEVIKSHGAHVAGVLIAVDRQEKGLNTLSAVQELEQKMNIPVKSIINLNNIIDYLKSNPNSNYATFLTKIEDYRQEYGV